MTCTETFHVGDRVCRRGVKLKTVGVVLAVFTTGRVHVRWPNGSSSKLQAASLIPESKFVARPIASPAESDWTRSRWVVVCDHPSGRWCSESGVNSFDLASETAALLLALGLVAAGMTDIRVRRQDWASWIPPGCRVARSTCRWLKIWG